MSLIDVKQIQTEAKKELAEEQTKKAKEKLRAGKGARGRDKVPGTDFKNSI